MPSAISDEVGSFGSPGSSYTGSSDALKCRSKRCREAKLLVSCVESCRRCESGIQARIGLGGVIVVCCTNEFDMNGPPGIAQRNRPGMPLKGARIQPSKGRMNSLHVRSLLLVTHRACTCDESLKPGLYCELSGPDK